MRAITCYPYSKGEEVAKELIDKGYTDVRIEMTNNGCCMVYCS